MKYINTEDIISVIQERLINESVALKEAVELENNPIVDDIESKTIDLVCSYIGGVYNCDKIFAEPPLRNGVLVQIIASIVVYRCVRRNAARKVPEDYISLYIDAIKQLEKIQSGAMDLIGLPELTDENGNSLSPIWGNNYNKDWQT